MPDDPAIADSWPVGYTDASPTVLVHEAAPVIFASLDLSDPDAVEAIRATTAAIAMQYDGLGAAGTADRNLAYADAIALAEKPQVRGWFAPRAIPPAIVGKWYLSSCGLLRRRIEAAIQVDSAAHYPNYVDQTAVSACENFARECRAWRDPNDIASLDRGDAIFRADRQHVATVVRRDGDVITTVDGGQGGGLSEGTEIATRHRRIVQRGGRVFLIDAKDPTDPGWPLKGFTDVTALRFAPGRRVLAARRVDAPPAA